MSEEFGNLIHELGNALFRQVESQLSGKPWDTAFLDVRYDDTGSSWLSKIRAFSPDGNRMSVKMNNEIDICLISLNKFKEVFEHKWHGILVKITADQQCEINLNYDSNCSQDSNFFDT